VTREEIEKRMDELARKYVETHDRDIIEELNRLSRQLQELESISADSEFLASKPRYSHIMHETGRHKASRLPKVRHLWMRKPKSGKTGFVASHHAKAYDWRRAGDEIQWLQIMVSIGLVSGRPGHIYVFIVQGDLDQVEDWLESGHRLKLR
jgi:hypothetical protein